MARAMQQGVQRERLAHTLATPKYSALHPFRRPARKINLAGARVIWSGGKAAVISERE